MNINDVYEIVLYACAKNQSQGYISPSDFNLLINQAQVQYTSYLTGSVQSYRPGRPMPTVEFGENSVVRQRLSPTIYGYNLNVDATGFSPYPNDYIQTDAMWSYYGFNRIRYVAQDRLFFIYNSVIDPIETNPIYLIQDTGFKFYPQSLGMAYLSYVRNPQRIEWAYTLDIYGQPVYDPINSIDPIWDDAAMWDIICRTLSLTGVNLQLGVVMNYAQDIKKTGQ